MELWKSAIEMGNGQGRKSTEQYPWPLSKRGHGIKQQNKIDITLQTYWYWMQHQISGCQDFMIDFATVYKIYSYFTGPQPQPNSQIECSTMMVEV